MWKHDISYEHPQAFFLIFLLIPLVFLWGFLSRYRRHTLKVYSSPFLLQRLLQPRSIVFTRMKFFAWILGWASLCMALMGPKGNERYVGISDSIKEKVQTQELIFLVDTSASMSVQDAHQGQSRLEDVKEIIESMITSLKGQTVSLYAFTSDLTPLVPSTLDYLFTQLMVDQMNINEGDIEGTNLTRVLEALKKKLFDQPAYFKDYTVLLFSDGGDNQIERLKGEERERQIRKITEILPHPAPIPFRLFSIGLGSKKGGIIPDVTFQGQAVQSALEEDVLQVLAQQNDGVYYSANDEKQR